MKKITFLAVLGSAMFTTDIKAQGEPFIGQISFVAFNFAPRGWAECNGQLLPIQQNTALYSLLGTTYGGNGVSTFALPDMRGRTVVHNGQAPGLEPYLLGQDGGIEKVTLIKSQMPAHTHLINASTGEGNTDLPTNAIPAKTKVLDKEYSTLPFDTQMKNEMVDSTGGNQPHENRPPYLVMKCIIALEGLYPSRN